MVVDSFNPLEEVDKKISWNNPNSKAIGNVLWIYTAVFWVIGAYEIVRILLNQSPAITVLFSILGQTISPHSTFIIMDIVLLAITVTTISFLTLIFIRKIAHYVMYFIIILGAMFSIAIGILIASNVDLIIGAFMILSGIILIGILVFKRERVRLSGRALELSADVVRQERDTLLATLIAMILTSWTSLSGLLTATYVYEVSSSINSSSGSSELLFLVILFLASWAVLFQTYFFDGIIIGITHAWYRSPKIDVASLSQGFRRSIEVQGSIALFAGLMSLLRFAVNYARRKGGAALSIIASILGLAEEIIKFITYYAVPAIVIRKTNVKRGIEDSVHMLKEMFIETLIGYFSFAPILYFFGFIYILLLGSIGYLASYYFLVPVYLADFLAYNSTISLINAFVYVFIGLFPLYVIFRTISVTFKTMLYEFGIDIETARKGEILPSRLPEDIKRDLVTVLEEKGIQVPAALIKANVK